MIGQTTETKTLRNWNLRLLTMKRYAQTIATLCFVLASLTACGGGGGSDTTTPPPVDTTLDWDQGNWDEEDWV